ncbi:MAG: hypothetical protein JSR80_05950 [Verrucomicrobia bacterium]|nr:hypothetical protein [Verrucomicrobiota bacterium]
MRAVSHLSLILSCLLPFAAFAEEYEERLILSSPEQTGTLFYTFDYQPAEAGKKEERATVTSANGSSIVYLISKDLLPLAIQSYDSQGALQLEKLYTWDEKQWLLAIEVRDGQQQYF